MLDPDANRLGMSLTGSYPVKISAIKNLETLEILSDYYLRLRREVLPLLDFLITVPSSLLLEKEKGNGTSLKNIHTSLRSF